MKIHDLNARPAGPRVACLVSKVIQAARAICEFGVVDTPLAVDASA